MDDMYRTTVKVSSVAEIEDLRSLISCYQDASDEDRLRVWAILIKYAETGVSGEA